MDINKKAHHAVPLPSRRGLCRVEAAGFIGVSPTTFDGLVLKQQMPSPKRVGTRKIWDVCALILAFEDLPSEDSILRETNEWNDVRS